MAESTITVRYFAAAQSASGCTSETVILAEDATLGDLRAELIARHGSGMALVLKVSGYLNNDELTRDLSSAASTSVDIMPPFAGG